RLKNQSRRRLSDCGAIVRLRRRRRRAGGRLLLILVAHIPFSQCVAPRAGAASALLAAAGRSQMLKIFIERKIGHAHPHRKGRQGPECTVKFCRSGRVVVCSSPDAVAADVYLLVLVAERAAMARAANPARPATSRSVCRSRSCPRQGDRAPPSIVR